jgi:hypothetical protein
MFVLLGLSQKPGDARTLDYRSGADGVKAGCAARDEWVGAGVLSSLNAGHPYSGEGGTPE